MTTIAYHHGDGLIAYDSRLTRGDTICTDEYEKMRVKDGISFVFCGVEDSVQKFVIDYPKFDSEFMYMCSGVMIKDGKARSFCFNGNGEFEEFELTFSEAWGSGSDHALTAMDCGLSAKEAVGMAIKRDIGSGGEIKYASVRV